MTTKTSTTNDGDPVTVQLIPTSLQWHLEILGGPGGWRPVCTRNEAPTEPPTDQAATLLFNSYRLLVPEGTVWVRRTTGAWVAQAHRI